MNDMEARARALFERSVQELDEVAVKRLRIARRSTLADAPGPGLRWQPWAGGLAAASVLALGLAWWWPRAQVAPAAPALPMATTPASAPADPGTEEPVLAEADDDADLYAWLAEAPVAADRPGHRL
jgi:hypothetical protein